MHHQHSTVAELLKDESFINYCRRQNEQDIRYWEKFLAEHPDRKGFVEEAVQEYQLLLSALAAADLEEQLQDLQKKLGSGEAAPVVRIPGSRGKIIVRRLRIGAAVAVLMLLGAGYFTWKASVMPAQPVHNKAYSSKPGERKSFQLPDGTQVSLNAGSTINVDAAFGNTTREVFLEGEAFFEVQQNKELPFIVHTAHMDIAALGTAFNVRSYTGEKTETALLRGLVEVTLKEENNRKILLRPDEKISWNPGINNVEEKSTTREIKEKKPAVAATTVRPVKKLNDGSVKEIAWMENKLVFDDEPFEEIVPQLERWYDVEISFASEEVKKFHFTATFKKEKLEQVLRILKTSKPFRYRWEGRRVVVESGEW